MKVLSVASEAFPLVKTGGLGDVAGALPAALAPHGVAVTTMLPGYPQVLAALDRPKVLHRWPTLLGTAARLLRGELAGHPLLVLEAPALFTREGRPYTDPAGNDWDDNWRRFAAFSRAAADVASGAVKGHAYDVLHAHDWQTGLAPLYLRDAPGPGTPARSVLTVHNIAFQGAYDAGIFPSLGLPAETFSIDGAEYYGAVGYLKAGLAAADAITTVSPTYAAEILTGEFGMGLEGLVASRRDRLWGIVNGIDPAVWSPEGDAALPARYSLRTLARRAVNKRAVEDQFGLAPDDGPIATVISRLTWQKGVDVLLNCLDAAVAMGWRLALLGSGDAPLEHGFRAAAARHPGRIGVRIGYDEPLSHLLQGGADAILVPSRFEPCGLTQLYGLAYGCVPIVARTGGLADTVIDANEAALAADVATGFQFNAVTETGLLFALARAHRLYQEPARWTAMQKRGMRQDFSWATSGARYAQLFRGLLDR